MSTTYPKGGKNTEIKAAIEEEREKDTERCQDNMGELGKITLKTLKATYTTSSRPHTLSY
jgi:hypothetical protein